jgi:hypothetical protein
VSLRIIFLCLVTLCASGEQHALADQDESKDFSLSNIRPKILTREEWHAKPALPGMRRQQPTCYYLAQHGSATEFATVNGEKVARPAELFSTSWNRVSESQEASLARHSLSFLY